MRNPRRWTLLAVMALSVLFIHEARATTLTGKVIEINDGDEITIFNLNRPVRIRLLGIDAPEKNQPFGDVARQHLSDLVFGKVVSVEYSGMDRHTTFIGRVLCNGVDISAQMIRDGAAWYAPQGSRLSETDQEIYSQSERAARTERRGLWQMDGPVAPWEFVKAENAQRAQEAAASKSSNGQVELTEPVFRRPTPELTSLGLRRTKTTSIAQPQSAVADSIAVSNWLNEEPVRNKWSRFFTPDNENLSALMPEGGKRFNEELPLGDKILSAHAYVSRDKSSAYGLISISAPSFGEPDDLVLQGIVRDVLRGTNCEPTSQRNISTLGFVGKEFDVSTCSLPGYIRIYTRVVGNERHLYLGVAVYKELDPNVAKFLKSVQVKDGSPN